MDGDDFDGGLAALVLVAALMMLGFCVFGADWVRPPVEGAGPFMTAERVHALRVVASVAAAICLICVVRAIWGRTTVPLASAGLAVAVVAVFAYIPYFPQPRIELRTDGFGKTAVQTTVRGTAVFYNSTRADLVVCLGVAGDCDADADGPAELRSPGLAVPAGRRVSVDMPDWPGRFRMTLVDAGPEVTRRDAIVYIERIQGP